MGFVLAILIAVFFNRIKNTKLALGRYNLKTTFWGFGILGGGVLLALCSWYVLGKLETDNTRNGFFTLGAIKASLVALSAYSYVVFLGIWKSSKDSKFIIKLASRYCSLFLLGIIVASLYFSWLNILVGVLAYYFINKSKKSKGVVAQINS